MYHVDPHSGALIFHEEELSENEQHTLLFQLEERLNVLEEKMQRWEEKEEANGKYL